MTLLSYHQVGDKPLYHTKPSASIGEQGHSAFFMFTNVVKLSVNQRVQGTNPEQIQFRDLLSRLRTGDSNEQDWKLLLTRQPSNVQNMVDFQHATRYTLVMKKLQLTILSSY